MFKITKIHLTKISIRSFSLIGIYLFIIGVIKAETIFFENFESGKMTARCSGKCPIVTEKIAYNGKHSLKVDVDYYDSYNNYRTELQEEGFANYDDVFWYNFSIYLPESYKTDSVWEVVAQWHGYPDFGLGENWRQPPLALLTTNGVWRVKSKWDIKANTFESGEIVYDGEENWELGAQKTDVWVNWVFNVKWSFEGDGLIKVWKDGQLVINKKGPNTFNDETAPYFKAGMYKGWQGSPKLSEDNVTSRELYLDDIMIKAERNIRAILN
jgi:hypothetical protein